MSRLDVRLASRYLRSRRSTRLFSLITLIAVGGVTLGVAALIVVMGVMSGLQRELREKILVASPHLRILTYGRGLRMEDWERVRDSVLAHPEVVAVAPFVSSQGLIQAGADYVEGASVLGVPSDTGTAATTDLASTFLSGDLRFRPTRGDVDAGVILGAALADRLSAYPGDRVTMISPGGSDFNAALGAFVPRFWTFEVIGHFLTGMYEYDNNYAVLPIEVAREFQGLEPDVVSGLDVRLTDAWRASAVGLELEERLGYPYRSLDWQEQNRSLFSALKLEKLAMGLILLLIVIVAAFNIVSTLTMLVRDKTREIGILRAMGLPSRTVRRVFVLQGAVIGSVGTALGTALGVGVARLVDRGQLIRLDPSVYFIDHLPILVQPFDLVIIVVAAVLVATTATLYPAREAAALAPVDAIRYE